MIRPLLFALAALAALAPAASPQEEEKKAPARDDLKERTRKHKLDVTRLRGLEFKNEVTVGVYSKAELLEFLKGEFEKELPREKVERFQRGYAKFGLIPDDLDLYDAYLELFGSSIAGFYHPKTKELRLIRAGEGDEADNARAREYGIKDPEGSILVHELTHAAQDQNFELSTLPLEDETNDDLIMALKGVIEGDASAVGWKYGYPSNLVQDSLMAYKQGMLPGKAGKLPAYLRLSLTFPYGHGSEFVLGYIKSMQGDEKDASRLLRDFPLSSEQILHPKKYTDDRDNPTLVTLPNLPRLFGDGWKESFNNVHGEFAIAILLRELKEDRMAVRKASEGWDGDRYVVLEKNAAEKGTMYVWYSTWDSDDDAKEFYEAYARALELRYGHAAAQDPRGDKTLFSTKSGQVLLERKETDVLVMDGATREMVDKADAIWKGAVKAEITKVERLKKFVCAKCGVKEAFSGKCPKCGQALVFQDKEEKKRVYTPE